MLPPLWGHNGWVISIEFLPDGSKIVSESCGNTNQVWDASMGVKLPPMPKADNDVPKSAESSQYILP